MALDRARDESFRIHLRDEALEIARRRFPPARRAEPVVDGGEAALEQARVAKLSLERIEEHRLQPRQRVGFAPVEGIDRRLVARRAGGMRRRAISRASSRK
jgi:hypothetical protein